MITLGGQISLSYLDTPTHPVLLVDGNRILEANDAAVNLLGLTADRPFKETTLDDLLGAATATVERIAGATHQVLRADGSRVWLRVERTPVTIRSHALTQVILHELGSSVGHAELIRSLPDSLVCIDEHGVVCGYHVGQQSDPPMGVAPIGRNIRELVPAEVADKYLRAVTSVLRSGHQVRFEHAAPHAGELAQLEVRITRASATQVVAVIRDITNAKLQERKELQSQRLEGIGRLAGGIAHDFNNLLTSVVAHSELTRFLTNDNPEINGHIDQILAAADRAAALTRELLAFSKSHISSARIVDVEELTLSLADLCRQILGEGNTLNLVLLADGAATVRADPRHLERALVNMIINSRDAMQDGPGRLTIAVRPVRVSEVMTRRHPEIKPGEYVLIAIRDTGRGMDEDTLHRLFDPFFTTKRTHDGAGLGLAAAYGIVSQVGGVILPLSKPGVGTTMAIYLPRATREESAGIVLTGESRQSSAKATLLLVEDDPMVREVTAKSLSRLGYAVYDAENGHDALRHYDQISTPIDILITDIVMPLMGGRELATRLRERQPDLKVLYISGYTHSALESKDLRPAGTSFLPKPFTHAELRRELDQLIGTGATR